MGREGLNMAEETKEDLKKQISDLRAQESNLKSQLRAKEEARERFKLEKEFSERVVKELNIALEEKNKELIKYQNAYRLLLSSASLIAGLDWVNSLGR